MLLKTALLLAAAGPTPVALVDESGGAFALAGSNVVYARGVDVRAVGVAGGSSVTLRRGGTGAEAPLMDASAQRTVVVQRVRGQLRTFAGPARGPLRARPGAALQAQVDGPRLYTFENGRDGLGIFDAERRRVARFLPEPEAAGARFAGAFVATTGETTDDVTARRFTVRDRISGAVRTQVELPSPVRAFDLRADGRGVVALADGRLFEVPRGGRPRLRARDAADPRWAGRRIVFRRGEHGLRVLDPGGRPRRVGVPTRTLAGFDVDDTRIAYVANRCLLVAGLGAGGAARPAPGGPCAHMELELLTREEIPLARTLRIEVRCVAGPCRGTVELRTAAGRRLNAPRRFALGAGRRARLAVRLDRAAYDALARRDAPTALSVHVREPGGPRLRLPHDELLAVR
jgi:hypothetical protein